MKPSEFASKSAQHIMLYGDPKSGKTTLVVDLIKHGFKLYYFSLDNGLASILNKYPAKLVEDSIELIIMPDTRDFPVAITTLLKAMTGAPVKICYTHGQVSCSMCPNGPWTFFEGNSLGPKDIVVIDHESGVAESAKHFITLKQKDNYEYKPDWDDWNAQGIIMGKHMLQIQNSPFNVISISHGVEVKMENGDKKVVPQIGTDNFSRNAGKYFDHVIYSSVMTGSHGFNSKSTYMKSVLTGSRSDVAIESLDKDKISLVPFFDGTMQRLKADNFMGAQAASNLLEGTDVLVSSSGAAVNSSALPNPDSSVNQGHTQNTSALDRLKALGGNKK